MKPLHKIPFLPGASLIHIAEDGGAIFLRSPVDRADLKVVFSNGDGWDHVSISRDKRCPNWEEMEYVKRLMFEEDEVAMQLHVPPSDHINCHPRCLHLWRPQAAPIPLPHSYMV